MNNEFLERILEEHTNGFLIINDKKEVFYANKIMRELFTPQVNCLLGDYLSCPHTIIEKKHCQETSMCGECEINHAINNILIDKETKNITDIDIYSNDIRLNTNIKIEYINSCIVMQVIQLDNNTDLFFLHKLMDRANDIMFYKDKHMEYKYVNKSYAIFLGKEKNQIINKRDSSLLSGTLLEGSLKSDQETLEKGRYSGVGHVGEVFYQVLKERIDGGILCVAKDITNEVMAYNKACIDELTGLMNRYKFVEVVDEVYKNKSAQYYLVLIDMDDLRNINNSYGHPRGDEYLKKVGGILGTYQEGMFFRLGGDEFVGLIPRTYQDVKKILSDILNDIHNVDLKPRLSISIGVKKLDLTKQYMENYQEADQLLYKSKREGKDRISYV